MSATVVSNTTVITRALPLLRGSPGQQDRTCRYMCADLDAPRGLVMAAALYRRTVAAIAIARPFATDVTLTQVRRTAVK